MTGIIFTLAARQDVMDAQTWYEKEMPGLGQRFVETLDDRIQGIAAHPMRYPQAISSIRRARLARFPYVIYFREHGGDIHVLACFHSSRNPSVWQKRL
ncbi:MAG: type II toxin-antitoxin system RelE/ParE family toxin [Asticcacaulis sp.]|uniref:type II toxin-antitoxin system RelE/ParE family toxin n=1 Tax=Asticcacaulis sp. TaxID=1872648 RepID=UPI003F7C94B1